jgi:hypothetical protein
MDMHPRKRLFLVLSALVGLFVTGGSDALAIVGASPTPATVAVTDGLSVVGRPLTPVSYAGVARRTVRRSHY